MKELKRCKDCPHRVSKCAYYDTVCGEVESPFGWTNCMEKEVKRYGPGCDHENEDYPIAFAINEAGCPLTDAEIIDYFGQGYLDEVKNGGEE